MVVPDLDQASDLTAELWAAIKPSKLKAAPFQSVNSPFWLAVTALLPSLAQHNALTGNLTLFNDWWAMVAQMSCLGKSAVPFGVDMAPNASLTGRTTSPGSLGLLPKTDLLASSRMISSEGSKAFLDWVLSILDYSCVRGGA